MSSSTVDAPPPPAPAIDPAEHLGLVRRVARPFIRRRPWLNDDILSAGAVGLLKAPHGPGVPMAAFVAYAKKSIEGEIRYMLWKQHALRVPRVYLGNPAGSAAAAARHRRECVSAAARSLSAKVLSLDEAWSVACPGPDEACRPPRIELSPLPGLAFRITARCDCGEAIHLDFTDADRRNPAFVRSRVSARGAAAGWIVRGHDAVSCPDCRPPGRLDPPPAPRATVPALRLSRADESAIRAMIAAGYSATEAAAWFGVTPALAARYGADRRAAS